VCGWRGDAFSPGPGGRAGARCPACGALERHRALRLVIDGLAFARPGWVRCLEVMPQSATSAVLDRAAQVRETMEVSAAGTPERREPPAGDGGWDDGSFDLVVALQVLQRVDDDVALLDELVRLLRPDGVLVLQVPWRPRHATVEDPAPSPEERTERYGHAEHRRSYGDDLEVRIAAAGLSVTRLTAGSMLSDALVRHLGLAANEPFWVCRPLPGGERRLRSEAAVLVPPLGSVAEHLLAQLGDERRAAHAGQRRVQDLEEQRSQLEAALATATAERDRWRAAHTRLRHGWPARIWERLTRQRTVDR
jgi:SAM-dependent methyltransferase